MKYKFLSYLPFTLAALLSMSTLAHAGKPVTYYIQSYNSGLFLKTSGNQPVIQVAKSAQPTEWTLDTGGTTDGGVFIKNAGGQCLSITGQMIGCTRTVYLHYMNPEEMKPNQDWCVACRFAITDSAHPFNQNPPQNCLTAAPLDKDLQNRGLYSKTCIQGGSNWDQHFRLVPVRPNLR